MVARARGYFLALYFPSSFFFLKKNDWGRGEVPLDSRAGGWEGDLVAVPLLAGWW